VVVRGTGAGNAHPARHHTTPTALPTQPPTTRAGYDPSRYKDSLIDDRLMEATPAQIAAEEARSKRIARSEDEREAEAEARRAAAKEAARRSTSGGRRKGAAALIDE
jgi:hypothetical protein